MLKYLANWICKYKHHKQNEKLEDTENQNSHTVKDTRMIPPSLTAWWSRSPWPESFDLTADVIKWKTWPPWPWSSLESRRARWIYIAIRRQQDREDQWVEGRESRWTPLLPWIRKSKRGYRIKEWFWFCFVAAWRLAERSRDFTWDLTQREYSFPYSHSVRYIALLIFQKFHIRLRNF